LDVNIRSESKEKKSEGEKKDFIVTKAMDVFAGKKKKERR